VPSQDCEKVTTNFVVSVCPHGTTRILLDEFTFNLMLEDSSKLRWENSSLVQILHKNSEYFT